MSQACLLGDLRIEATTSDHVARMPEELSDRFVDGWRENGHSRVVLAGDDIVATGLSCPNRVHPTRDLLFITVREAWRRQGIGTLLHRELSALHQVPFSAKAAPGSATHAFVTSLGAWVYQHCPGGRVDAALPEVREWARRHRGDGADGGGPVVRRGEELGPGRLRELITDLYEVVHASWSPTDRAGILHDITSDLSTSELRRCRWVERDGEVTALADVYREDDKQWAHIEALHPAAPSAREDVAACFAAVLEDQAEAAGGGRVTNPIFFDQHHSDPHAYPLLMSIPGVGGEAVELLEIPLASPPTLRNDDEVTASSASLRPWTPDDAAALLAAAQESPDLERQLPRMPQNLDDAKDILRAGLLPTGEGITTTDVDVPRPEEPEEPDPSRLRAVNLAIDLDGRAVGNVGLSAIERTHETAWMHYWITSSARGQGLTTRAVATVAGWALAPLPRGLGLYRLELGHRRNNPASRAVAIGAGFVPEGVERAKLRYVVTPDDHSGSSAAASRTERFDVQTHARLLTDPAPDVELLPLSVSGSPA